MPPEAGRLLSEGGAVNRPRPRIESLADLIFGLALSVGAISLVSQPPTRTVDIYRDIGTFGFSFIVLITIWLRYTRIMSVLPVESPRTTRLNTALLFCVSVEPFLFGLLSRPPAAASPSNFVFEETASGLFALDLGIMMAILGIFSLTLASEERGLVGADFIRLFKKEAYLWFVGAAAFLISTLPVFYTTEVGGPMGSLRYYLWLIPIFSVWFRRISGAGASHELPD